MSPAVVFLTWSFGEQALAADAKPETADMVHKCAAATSVDEMMGYYDPSEDLVVYDGG